MESSRQSPQNQSSDTEKMGLTSGDQEKKNYEQGMQHFSDSSSSLRVLMSSKQSRSSSLSSLSSESNNSKKAAIITRRSRASKKTPVTLLNANASNFRALVQQFTGCLTTPLSLGVPSKGLIILNFQRGIREMQAHLDNNNNQVLRGRFHQNHHLEIQSQVLDHQQAVQKINVVVDVGDDDDCVIMQKFASTNGDSSSCAVSSLWSSGCGLEVSHDLPAADFYGSMEDFSLQDLNDMDNALFSDNDLGYFV